MTLSQHNEACIWNTLIHEQEAVSSGRYESLAMAVPRVYPARATVPRKKRRGFKKR